MHHNINGTRSVLASLRSVIPNRNTITFHEALLAAELQANRLLELWGITSGPTPTDVVSELPRMRIVYEELAVSGTSHWSGSHWVISLNRHEPRTRQRFTLMHEFKHIIDHYSAERLYTGDRRHSPAQQAELAADYFAGCVLLPKRFLKSAWGRGIQTPTKLASAFNVSAMAADVRLAQTGLNLVRDRCPEPLTARLNRGRPSFRQPRYQRLAAQGA